MTVSIQHNLLIHIGQCTSPSISNPAQLRQRGEAFCRRWHIDSGSSFQEIEKQFSKAVEQLHRDGYPVIVQSREHSRRAIRKRNTASTCRAPRAEREKKLFRAIDIKSYIKHTEAAATTIQSAWRGYATRNITIASFDKTLIFSLNVIGNTIDNVRFQKALQLSREIMSAAKHGRLKSTSSNAPYIFIDKKSIEKRYTFNSNGIYVFSHSRPHPRMVVTAVKDIDETQCPHGSYKDAIPAITMIVTPGKSHVVPSLVLRTKHDYRTQRIQQLIQSTALVQKEFGSVRPSEFNSSSHTTPVLPLLGPFRHEYHEKACAEYITELFPSTLHKKFRDAHFNDSLIMYNYLTLFVQLANHITTLHKRKLYHNDVKPENIVVKIRDEELSATLIDFDMVNSTESIFDPHYPFHDSYAMRYKHLTSLTDHYGLAMSFTTLLLNHYPGTISRYGIEKKRSYSPEEIYFLKTEHEKELCRRMLECIDTAELNSMKHQTLKSLLKELLSHSKEKAFAPVQNLNLAAKEQEKRLQCIESMCEELKKIEETLPQPIHQFFYMRACLESVRMLTRFTQLGLSQESLGYVEQRSNVLFDEFKKMLHNLIVDETSYFFFAKQHTT